MNAPSEFTPDEWSLVQKAPMLVFYYIANADNQIDPIEVEQLIRHFDEAERYKSDLFTRTVQALLEDPENLERLGRQIIDSKTGDLHSQIADVQTLIDKKLEVSEANAFKHALVMLGVDIAAASGDAELPVSKEEWAEVAAFKKLLKI